MFGKLSRLISTQVKLAKGDKNSAAVKAAIEKARAINMPVDTIDRAIAKATDVRDLETIVYEAYGPAGVGIIIEALTDNRNKAAQEIKFILSKHGASLGAIGSVTWAFAKENTPEGMTWKPVTMVSIPEDNSPALEALIDELEENEEVQDVFTNAE